MTIGVGFLCTDGIVLCSDRQMTDPYAGFKFEEQKISYHLNADLSFVFSYSGDPDAARAMFGRLSGGLWSGVYKSKQSAPRDKALTTIEQLYKHRDAKNLQSLIGIRFKNTGIYLFRTSGHKVVNGITEYIGVGDSSVLRYVCDRLISGGFDVNEGDVLGQYLVSVASRYVDGCSGGPDRIILRKEGGISEGTGGPFPNTKERFQYCEEQTGNALRELLLAGGNKKIVLENLR